MSWRGKWMIYKIDLSEQVKKMNDQNKKIGEYKFRGTGSKDPKETLERKI